MAESELDLAGVALRVVQTRGALTQAEFAAQLGVDRKTVVRWEGADRLPDGESLHALYVHFGADPAWLLTGSGVPPPLTAREAVLLDNYRAAGDAGRRAIESTASALAGGSQPPSSAGSRVTVHGNVGQAAAGDMTVHIGHKRRSPR